ncbi:MAG: PLP-dependent transferase [Sedimentisphaerales bacterium]
MTKGISSNNKNKKRSRVSLATRAIHAGEPREKYADSLMTPIVQTSTYTFKNSKAIEDYTQKGKEHYEYGRYGNPTAKIAEQRLTEMVI